MSPVCNLCGSPDFKDFNTRPNSICSRCGAYERTRVLKLMLDQLGIGAQSSVLHIAPERGLYSYLRSCVGRYVVCDIDVERYSHIPELRQLDLCDPSSFGDLGEFDFVIHNHVIEHVPCNWTAVMIRLHKLLSDDGVHLFSMPIYGRSFEEDLAGLSGDERTRRFGQYDHCRRFSANDLQETLGAVFRIPMNYDLEASISVDLLDAANIPQYARRGLSGHSIFSPSRQDLLL